MYACGDRPGGDDVESGAQVRVVVWNLNWWQQGRGPDPQPSWRYLDEQLPAVFDWDVALLQECAPPEGRTNVVFRPVRDARWGTAVVTRAAGLREITIEDDSHPGGYVAAEVDLGDRGRVSVVSLYGMHEFAKTVDGELYDMRYITTSIHRVLSDLTPLVDHHGRHRTKLPLIMGGDLNTSTQIDPPDRERHRNILERFATMGLTDGWQAAPDTEPAPDCTCPDHPDCRHVRTHTHPRSVRPWQIDYVFANPALRVVSCRTIVDDETWQRSDHAPVTAVLERR